jgi:hypothetical protein
VVVDHPHGSRDGAHDSSVAPRPRRARAFGSPSGLRRSCMRGAAAERVRVRWARARLARDCPTRLAQLRLSCCSAQVNRRWGSWLDSVFGRGSASCSWDCSALSRWAEPQALALHSSRRPTCASKRAGDAGDLSSRSASPEPQDRQGLEAQRDPQDRPDRKAQRDRRDLRDLGAGAPGPQGEAGPPGPAGPPGLSGVERVCRHGLHRHRSEVHQR